MHVHYPYTYSLQHRLALIVGDSFVKRLEAYCSDAATQHLDLYDWRVVFKGRSGGSYDDLGVALLGTAIMQPDAILFHCGGNDISGEPGLMEQRPGGPRHVHGLAQGLIGYAVGQRNTGVRNTFVGKLYYRARGARLRSDGEVDNYNAKVDAVNAELDRMVPTLPQGVHIWNHKGRVLCAHEILDQDGTHLNPRGLRKHWWSWRRALITAGLRMDHG